MGFTGGGTSGAAVNVPVGACIPFGGAGAPSGYLLCDGQAVNRITFGNLFAIIGTQYGPGDGSTTFNVPDMRTDNSFPRGAIDDAGRGNTGGLDVVTLTSGESGVPAHVHGGSPNPPAGVIAAGTSFGSGLAGTLTALQDVLANTPANAADAHENQPPFVDFNWIIKA